MVDIKGENNIFFDIDGTMVLYGKEGKTVKFNYHGIEDRYLTPHTGHISFLKALKARGFTIFLFSNNGWQWCREVARQLKIEDVVDYGMTKPQKVVDDEKVENYIKTIYIPYEE
jgi:FMN phosphatase YigB (HAD superfamily)